MRDSVKAVVLVLALILGAGSAPAHAGKPGSPRHVGLLSTFRLPIMAETAFRQALTDFGYVEGRDLVIEPRYAGGEPDRLPALATELVDRKVDVIVTVGTVAAQAARKATSTIPIVLMVAGDPVGVGLAASLARPGGNVTGVSVMTSEMSTKRLELLKEIAPRARRVGILFSLEFRPLREIVLGSLKTAAASVGIELHPIDVRRGDELPQVFARLGAARADAVYVYGFSIFMEHKDRLFELLRRRRLPAVFIISDLVEAGGLMSYGVNLADAGRGAASYVDRILKGANPATLPIEQAVRFELVINLKTAKSLRLSVPPAILLRADRVIE